MQSNAYFEKMEQMYQRQASWNRSASSSSSPTAKSPPSRPGAVKEKSKRKTDSKEDRPRKKVAKACLTCQKSHLTCDAKRPCTRCVNKGISDRCVEGLRKKAKYLLDEDDAAGSSGSPTAVSQTQHNLVAMPVSPPLAPPPQEQQISDDLWLAPPATENDWDSTFLQNNYPAANLEYEMLDSMFGAMSPIYPGLNDFDPAALQFDQQNSLIAPSWPSGNPAMQSQSSNPTQVVEQPGILQRNIPSSSSSIGNGRAHDSTAAGARQSNREDNSNNWSAWMDLEPAPISNEGQKGLTASEVYRTVVKPYDYTEGYHVLMQYITKNFEQPDVLRVVRALAAFRPSLIALQMPMSEEDEVFIERSFQRTMIELEKLISYSATPTAVWRRTGEICYVGPEFCKLVAQTEQELVGSTTYIYELFTKPSVIAYWENFSVHAFENTEQNFFQPTNLKIKSRAQHNEGAQDEELRCSGCFTIRRDVFDLPSVVIGQFLPITQ